MNPWESMWFLLGWLFLGLVVLVAVLIILGILLAFWQWIRKPSARTKERHEKEDMTVLLEEATRVALGLYKDEVVMANELVNAFRHGARYGWGFPRRK